ncbi:MAG: c-type cytochrome [Candidatus Kapabacteria bacterium]|nr:c-type cytochrome [Candidatus Kapabacteria bacterium]
MPLFNLAYPATYFWDGRAATLRQQVLMPIQDPIEMHESLGNVTAKLRASSTYPALFKRAFGSEEITPQTMALALEQFLHTMLSYNSRFDRSRRGELQLTPQEDRGAQLFFTEFNPASSKKGADCFHCHGTSLFTNNEFMNNGLDSAHQFTDMGHFDVTGNPQHKATFKTPSLRNIEVTAPYMHDGRFRTLEEVIEHYNSGVKFSETLATDLKVTRVGLNLTPQDKADLLAFLRTLTDTTFLNDKRFAKP